MLQDTHWSGGAFGYFPTYTLGTIYSAMLWERLRRDLPDVDGQIAAGEFAPLLGWLREHIHHPGSLYEGPGADRASHRGRARSPPADALPVGQVRPALRTGTRVTAVLDLFLELAEISSPPGEERAVADVVTARLAAIGVEVDEDAAGAAIGSQIGNLYARLAPNLDTGTPIFLNAHLDTVPATAPIRPEVRNGVVVNAEETILGADNKAAVAAMVAAVEQVVADGSTIRGSSWC